MATYTPLKLNQTPTLGTSGASIKSYQTSLNTQNAGQSGYVPLKVDGMFGPLTQAASQFKAPVTNPMVNPTTPTFKPATVPTGTFESQDTANARTAQASYLNSLVQPDENKIYQDTLSKFQAQIDSTNAMYADELSRAKVTGAGRLGTQTAMSARRGLLGSDFGEASAVGQERGNEEVYKSIENERATRVNAILSQAKSDSSSEIRAKREEFTKGLDARLSFYSEADNRKTANSDKAIKALIAQGLGPKDVDPSQLSQIAKYYGISTDDIIAGYDGAKKTIDEAKAVADLEAAQKGQFNLSEGQARYDASGKLIASRGKTSAPNTSAKGNVSPTGTGNVGSDLNYLYQITRTGKNGNTVKLLDSAWNSARNDRDRINLLAQNVVLPAQIKSDLIQRSTAIPMIDNAISLLDSGVQTGYFNNLGEKAFNKFGNTTDPKINQIKQAIISAVQPYRSSVTGAAWGAQEEAEYQALFGSTLDNPVFLKSKLESMKKLMLQSNIATISSGLSVADPSMAQQYLGGTPNATNTENTTQTFVKMVSPNGQIGNVSQSKVQSAQSQGWRITQ